MHLIAFDSLPEDLQCLIEQLVLDHDEDATIPAMLPLGSVAVADLPDVPLDPDDRGRDHALAMDLDEVPPVLVAECLFLDGRHRAFAARHQGRERLAAIDLTGIVAPCVAVSNAMGSVAEWVPGWDPCPGGGTPPSERLQPASPPAV